MSLAWAPRARLYTSAFSRNERKAHLRVHPSHEGLSFFFFLSLLVCTISSAQLDLHMCINA